VAIFAWSTGLGVLLGAVVIDPVWATPVNTFLLIVLAVVSIWRGRTMREHAKKVEELPEKVDNIGHRVGAVQRSIIHAVQASADAAESASDAARIAKEIGGAVRKSEPPPTPPNGIRERRGSHA
jgi:hypothetical protein